MERGRVDTVLCTNTVSLRGFEEAYRSGLCSCQKVKNPDGLERLLDEDAACVRVEMKEGGKLTFSCFAST
jgi:hypothetical protein